MPFFMHNEMRVHYLDKGEGPLLMVLPGNTASSAVHQGEVEHFSHNHRVVCPDWPGTGRTGRLAEWPLDWWQRNVDVVIALLDHLGEEKAILVGSSGGGLVALTAAILHPTRVRALIAESCVQHYPPERVREMIEGRREPSPELIGFWQFAHGEDWQDVVAADTDLLRRIAAEGEKDFFEGRLGEIGCPAMLAGSYTDDVAPDVPGQMLAMTRQIPEAQLLLVNGGGHPLMWTRPEPFRRAADAFLAALPAVDAA